MFKIFENCNRTNSWNKKTVEVPEEILEEGQKQYAGKNVLPQQIHYSNVRLVTNITQQDGTVKKVAVRRILRGKLYGRGKRLTWHRYIPGEVIKLEDGKDHTQHVPWPRRPKADTSKVPLGPQDTASEIVSKITFAPTSLEEEPLPESVKYELHNKYSEKYKAIRREEAAKNARPVVLKPMYTPEMEKIKEMNRAVYLENKEKAKNRKLDQAVIDLLSSRIKESASLKESK